MTKDDIAQGMSEIYMYNCSRCGQGNLSRDEVFATKSGTYLCLKCWHKSNAVDKGGNK